MTHYLLILILSVSMSHFADDIRQIATGDLQGALAASEVVELF